MEALEPNGKTCVHSECCALGQSLLENCQEAEPESPSCSCSSPVSPGRPGGGRAGQLGRLSTTGCPRAQQGCTGCPCHLQPQQKPSWHWHNLSPASLCGLNLTQLVLATSTVTTSHSLSTPCPGSVTWALAPVPGRDAAAGDPRAVGLTRAEETLMPVPSMAMLCQLWPSTARDVLELCIPVPGRDGAVRAQGPWQGTDFVSEGLRNGQGSISAVSPGSGKPMGMLSAQ